MKVLLWIVALFALAVGLVVAARYNEGYVLMVLPPYRVEIALNLLVVLIIAAFALFYSVVRLVGGAVQMPARVRQYRLARRRDKAQDTLLTALEAYFEGQYARAEEAAARSISLGEHKRLAAVIAARSAHALGAYERRDRYLRDLAEADAGAGALHGATEAALRSGAHSAHDALSTYADDRALPPEIELEPGGPLSSTARDSRV